MRAGVAAGRSMRFAYADPPYPGLARYYAGHPDFAGEVDHRKLIRRLVREFPDGWALSTSAAALQLVLGWCPAGVRVASWVRGERPTRSYRPLSAWEPLIVYGGRPYLSPVDQRRTDALVYHARPRMTEPRRVIGAKPGRFCWWLIDQLGALPGDELVDLFPGSGGVSRAWRYYASRGDDASRGSARRLLGSGQGSATAPKHPDPGARPGGDRGSCAILDSATGRNGGRS